MRLITMGTASENSSILTNPTEFWEKRHQTLDPWRSGGDRGISIAENYELHVIRTATIVRSLRRHLSGEIGLAILDAGSGRGHLTNDLRKCGHDVRGIDSSATAIAKATAEYGPYFSKASLWQHRPSHLYDAIVCVDVLFHVLDDSAWRDSLTAFTRYSAAESLLILTDVFGQNEFRLGSYIVHRTRDTYIELLQTHGYELLEYIPYDFGANPNSFAVFRRAI